MRPLTDQERTELLTSKAMTPGERLDWLAAALEFVRMCEGKKPKPVDSEWKNRERCLVVPV